ncbi:MAG: YetF domain-containing protein [Gemmatimonadaceae bacterium]
MTDAGAETTFGDDERFDRQATIFRRVAWGVIAPLLLIGAWTWRVQGSAVSSSVVRAALVYFFVLVLLRLAGKRTLGEMSTFDLVILLILSEAVQPAMVGEDNSLTNAVLLVTTLIAIDVFLGFVKSKSGRAARWLDDVPTVLVREGMVDSGAMSRSHVGVDDVMKAARLQHGLLTFREVRFAILESDGGISIIPTTNK